MILRLFISFFLMVGLQIVAQTNQLVMQFDQSSVQSESFQLNNLKFYIGDFSSDSTNYHLVDFQNQESRFVSFSEKAIQNDTLWFYLGVDSLTNVSGVMGGDLDPTKGMYWAWHSGYINFKLEGTSPESPERNSEFTFHLGGYADPYPTVQKIGLSLTENKGDTIFVKVDIQRFLSQIDLTTEYKLMRPGKRAQELSQMIARCFYIDEKK